MRLNIIAAVLLFFMVLESDGAELMKNPNWTFEKNINFNKGVKCEIAKRNKKDNKLIEIFVGMYVKNTIRENSSIHSAENYATYNRIDFSNNSFSLNTENYGSYNLLLDKLKKNAKYLIYIYSTVIDIPDEVLLNSKYTLKIIPKRIVGEKPDKDYPKDIFKEPKELKTMTIGFIDENNIYTTNFCDIYFDEQGYGYLEYVGSGQKCNPHPKKPDVLVSNKKIERILTQSEPRSITQSVPKSMTQIQVEPTIAKPGGITQTHKSNKYSIENDTLLKDEDLSKYKVTTVKGKIIENYTITYNQPHYYFSKSLDKSDAIILLKDQKPLYSLSKNKGAYTLSELKRAFFIKNDSTFNLLKKLLNIKINTYNPIDEQLQKVREYFNNLKTQFDLSVLDNLVQDKQYKYYIVFNQNGNCAVVNDQYYLEWNGNRCFFKTNKDNKLSIMMNIKN